ncbi:MAG TPA: GrpB family protein [Povalibacter sp.]|nr:GrpB family protein [Povalibacter sp.]
MPPPIRVELLSHDPRWAELAAEEGQRLRQAVPSIVVVHHVGSTAIAGISAKPVLDLLPVVRSLGELDLCRSVFNSLGYEWWGELGLPGRRYCTRSDPGSGRRLVQLHCYEQGSTEIRRHVAFRDYLRQRPDVAQAYDRQKHHCASLHPEDSHAYSDCKSAWIQAIEAQALSRLSD